MTDNQVRLYVRRDPDGPRWLWDVYEDGDRCYVEAGTCHTWALAMTFGILALHRAYGLPLPERPESGVLV